MSFNARSIRNKIESLMAYLTDFSIDIILLQETWLRKSDGAMIKSIEEYGYNVLSSRKRRKIDLGGGVAAVYRNSLKVIMLKLASYKSFEYSTPRFLRTRFLRTSILRTLFCRSLQKSYLKALSEPRFLRTRFLRTSVLRTFFFGPLRCLSM